MVNLEHIEVVYKEICEIRYNPHKCRNYKEIPIIVPVDGKGYLNELAGEFSGLYYEKSNEKIIENSSM